MFQIFFYCPNNFRKSALLFFGADAVDAFVVVAAVVVVVADVVDVVADDEAAATAIDDGISLVDDATNATGFFNVTDRGTTNRCIILYLLRK